MPVSHRKYSTAPEGADATLVRASDWNQTHRLSAEVDIEGDFDPTLLARLTFRNNSDRVLTFGQNMAGNMVFTRYVSGTAVGEPIAINIATGAVTVEGMSTDLKSAIQAKVTAVTSAFQVYATSNAGAPITLWYEAGLGSLSLIQRDASGRADVQKPLVDNPKGIMNVEYGLSLQPALQKTPLGAAGITTQYAQSWLDGFATVSNAAFGANQWRSVKVTVPARTRLIPVIRVQTVGATAGAVMYAGLYTAAGTLMIPGTKVLDLGSFGTDTVGTIESSLGAQWVDAGEYYLVWQVNGASTTGNLAAVTTALAGLTKAVVNLATPSVVSRWDASSTTPANMPNDITAVAWAPQATPAICPIFFRIP